MRKTPPDFSGGSGSRGSIFGIESSIQDSLKFYEQGLNILAVVDREDDEGESAAKAVAMFKIGVGTGAHHKFLGEFLLAEVQ